MNTYENLLGRADLMAQSRPMTEEEAHVVALFGGYDPDGELTPHQVQWSIPVCERNGWIVRTGRSALSYAATGYGLAEAGLLEDELAEEEEVEPAGFWSWLRGLFG